MSQAGAKMTGIYRDMEAGYDFKDTLLGPTMNDDDDDDNDAALLGTPTWIKM